MKKHSNHWALNFDLSKGSIPYIHTGRIQLHHVIEQVLEQCGEADIFISTYTVNEEFIRRLIKLDQDGVIRKLTMLIDARNAQKTPHLSWFLSSISSDVYLADNHSKVILINDLDHKVTIVTSQNSTRGNRMESGIVLTDPDIYDQFMNQYLAELPNYIKLTEVLARHQ